MKFFQTIGLLLGFSAAASAAPLKVVSLHPLITDLLKQVGKQKIEVIDLLGKTGDPHTFQPTPGDLADAQNAKFYFVSGMGMATYLDELKSILAGKAEVFEVGNTLPTLHGACDHGKPEEAGHEGHEEHEGHHHELDPHWWHSVDHFRRAANVVSEKLSEIDPENSEFYQKNTTEYRSDLDDLEKWMRREIVKIPKDNRKLATAHEAFNYFCDAYGFEAFAVQGLTREQMPDAVSLAELISTLKEEKVGAIFPEQESNPKMLQSLTADTGIKLGGSLIADGRGMSNYEEMMRRNVKTIVDALAPSSE